MENQTRSDFFVCRVNVGSCFLAVDLGMSQYILMQNILAFEVQKKETPANYFFLYQKERMI
jgi:hypothetical protein